MCKSCAEGGRRCRDNRRLKELTHSDLLPASTHGRPDVTWNVGVHVEPELASLWDKGSGLSQASVAEAIATLFEVAKDEPVITSDVIDSVPAGANAHGLEFRLKSPSSLARKINDRVMRSARSQVPLSPGEVAERLTDIVRYTIKSDRHEDLTPTIRRSIRTLTGRGYVVVEADNSYVEGSNYKGFHTLLRSPAGRVFELQFHSEQSQGVKDQTHLLYEQARRMSDDDVRLVPLLSKMESMSQGLPEPAGLGRIKTLGGIKVQVRKK